MKNQGSYCAFPWYKLPLLAKESEQGVSCGASPPFVVARKICAYLLPWNLAVHKLAMLFQEHLAVIRFVRSEGIKLRNIKDFICTTQAFRMTEKIRSISLDPGTRGVRKISCNFFLVNVAENASTDFISVVNSIVGNKPQPVDRNQKIQEGFARLSGWQVTSGIGHGNLQRIRTDQSARIAKLASDDVRDLILHDGEYLTELFAFAYYDEFQIIVIHRNWYAGGHTRLSDYINQMYGKEIVAFEAPLSTSAMQRFKDSSNVIKAQIRLGIPDQFTSAMRSGYNVNDAIVQLGSEIGAAEINIRLTKGRRKKPMLDGLKHFFNSFLEGNPEMIRGASVVVRPDNNAEEVTIDLLSDRIFERVEVGHLGVTPGLEDYYGAIDIAYKRRYKELSESYGSRRR